jgi:hypothetical protein
MGGSKFRLSARRKRIFRRRLDRETEPRASAPPPACILSHASIEVRFVAYDRLV